MCLNFHLDHNGSKPFQFENESKFDIRSSREGWKNLLWRALFPLLTLRGKMILLFAPRARSLSFFSKNLSHHDQQSNCCLSHEKSNRKCEVRPPRAFSVRGIVVLVPGKTETSFSATMALICFTQVYFSWGKEWRKFQNLYTNLLLFFLVP